MSDLRPEYRLGLGQMDVDLRRVTLPPGATEINVRVGVGEAVVHVPDGTCLTTNAKVAVGAIDAPDRVDEGRDLHFEDTTTAKPGQSELVVEGRHRGRAPPDRPLRILRMRHGRGDRTLIAAGLAAIALGGLSLLDRTDVIDIGFDYMLPAIFAAIGFVLLAAGLSE